MRLTWGSAVVVFLVSGCDEDPSPPIVRSAALLSDAPDWSFEPDQAEAHLGAAVAGVGDVDADGYDDVVVSATGWDDGELDEGRVYLFRGSASGLEAAPAWTSDSNQDAALYGVFYGAALAPAGDVNGDGYADLIIGAHSYSEPVPEPPYPGEGWAWVFHGSASGLEDTPAWQGRGNADIAEYGWAVSSAGDVDADGYDDVVVSARNISNDQNYEGRAYLYRGSADGLEDVASWSAESNELLAHFGMSVTGGDVDADGYSDVVVAAEEGTIGLSWYRGSAGGLEDSPSWTNDPDGSIWSVTLAGDLNGDGFADLVVGGGAGTWVHLGSADGPEDEPAWRAQSAEGGINFGYQVAYAGDVNGDGLADVAIGEYDASDGQIAEGLAFVYHGSVAGLADEPAWVGQLDQDTAELARAIAGAGDVDGDGQDDLVVGAQFHDGGEDDEGIAVLYLGAIDDGTACEGGLYRDEECNDTHCFIDGTWVLNGDVDPAAPCRLCLVATSQSEWSAGMDGTACDGGLCRAGECTASCLVGDDWFEDGAANPDGECELCRVAGDARAWSSAPDGTGCTGGLCRDGTCSPGECFLDGAWYVNGDARPDDVCRICNVNEDPTAWSWAADGTECEEGLCRDGACEVQRCYIERQWYVDGAQDPTDECRVCDVARARDRWSASTSAPCGGADAGPPGGDGDDDGGCSCGVAPGQGGGLGAGLWVVGALGLVIRRCARRSPRRPPARSRRGSPRTSRRVD